MTISQDLRALAAFYDSNPALEEPDLKELSVGVDSREQLTRFAQALPRPLRKEQTEHYFWVAAVFGEVTLKVYVAREMVCTRREVGTRVLPATKARRVPVYEWTCPDGLLSDSSESVESDER